MYDKQQRLGWCINYSIFRPACSSSGGSLLGVRKWVGVTEKCFYVHTRFMNTFVVISLFFSFCSRTERKTFMFVNVCCWHLDVLCHNMLFWIIRKIHCLVILLHIYLAGKNCTSLKTIFTWHHMYLHYWFSCF